MPNSFRNKNYHLWRNTDEEIKKANFPLHSHPNMMEILLLYAGDAEFHIEGNIYPLEPLDVVIASSNELHRMVHRSMSRYERFVININTEFFANNKCKEFESIFTNRRPGEQNLIKHNTPEGNQLLEILTRLQKYAFLDNPLPLIVTNTLIELLYVLNQKDIIADNIPQKSNIREIILYINEHLTEQMTLDKISNEFFMSKYHLCHLFKKHTGFTVNQYITRKRIDLVKDICESGNSLTFAASEAGFNNYSAFYRAYLKENGKSPKSKQ